MGEVARGLLAGELGGGGGGGVVRLAFSLVETIGIKHVTNRLAILSSRKNKP